MSFDENSSTHIAVYTGVVLENLEISTHSRVCGYPLFRILDKTTDKEYSLGIMIEDWNTFFKTPIDDVKLCQLSDGKESHFYGCLTDKVVEDLRNKKASNIETKNDLWK